MAGVDDLAGPGVAAALVITHRRIAALPPGVRDNEATVVYHPPCLSVGIGCSRGVPEGAIAAAVEGVLANHGLAPAAVRELASIDLKGDEAGLLAYAGRLARPLRLFDAAALDGVAVPNPSPVVLAAVGTGGVAEPAALLASGAPALLVEKQVRGQVTVAVALREETGD